MSPKKYGLNEVDYVRAAMGIVNIPIPEDMTVEKYIEGFREFYHELESRPQGLSKESKAILDNFLERLVGVQDNQANGRKVIESFLDAPLTIRLGVEYEDSEIRRQILERNGDGQI
jgi:hypothetical protein